MRRRPNIDSFHGHRATEPRQTPKRAQREDPREVALRRAALLFGGCFGVGVALVVFTHSFALTVLVGIGMPLAFGHMLLRASGHTWQDVALVVQSRSQRAWASLRRR
jgi:hypothetical protein